MLKIQKNVVLAPYTTLKIGAAADFFAIVKNRADVLEAIQWSKKNKYPLFILGGGSNVLVSGPVKGMVLKNEIKGAEISQENPDGVLVTAFSGEPWSKFVKFTIDHNLYGLENLFLIYGTVGAAPVQNIGAYGVELKDVFYHLKAIDLKTGHEKIFSLSDCHFGYRDSVFKKRLKGRYFIYSVTVKLSRQLNFKLDYGSIRTELEKRGIKSPQLNEVIRIIAEIRNRKLPNPGILPNAGSFFKNAEISRIHFNKLVKKYPDIPSFPVGRKSMKIPAGWLIEQAGFKGKKIGPVRMYEKQALILVNQGKAEAKHVFLLVKKVKAAVKKRFAIDLEEEVNII